MEEIVLFAHERRSAGPATGGVLKIEIVIKL